MRNHDYLMEHSSEYREAMNESHRASAAQYATLRDWLKLRKRMREYFTGNPDLPIPSDIKKMIGWRK